MVAPQVMDATLWKPSRIAPAIEQATSPAPPRIAPPAIR